MSHDEIRAAIAASAYLLALAQQHDTTEIAAELSVGRTRLGTVPTAVFASWAAATGMRCVIEDRAAATGDPLRASALTLRDVLVGGASGINLAYPGNLEMLNAWVSAGALTTQARDSLIALASTPAPVAEFDVRCAIFNDDGTLRV